ncbi:hypothetical protein HXX76_002331 [Chlamydomonas incerta]|uniref:Uncharacterized protein n=1 Tax=Chlamydomonas incerta TaxID=51695 RepID=A0A835SE84_CHLIN|nr:hypothetical protein HXX76_002331 [Chlamydomonas incerta]|eukprot:KAG2423107.1 hypothetical protein HXX76_002331 [Chlamydomonas incerta]
MVERLKQMQATGEQLKAPVQIAAAPAGPTAQPVQSAAPAHTGVARMAPAAPYPTAHAWRCPSRPRRRAAAAAAAAPRPAAAPNPATAAAAAAAAAKAAAAVNAAAAARPKAPTPAPAPVRPAPAPVPAPAPRPAPAPARPAPPPAPAPTTSSSSYGYGGGGRLVWECCMTSDESDHNRDPVQALQFVPAIPGLPGGDGHGGWLVSSSRRLLNLWECSPGGGRGVMSIMLLHSQETEFVSSRLAAEPSSRLLFAASTEARSGAEFVTVHSLDAEAGMLAYKYKLAVTPPNAPKPPAPPVGVPPVRHLSGVASLSAFGGGLAGTCGAAYQSQVYVYDTPGLTPAPGANRPEGVHPKGSWKAHDGGAPITALAASAVGGARVVTGFRDGSICVWDMRQKPPAAAWRNKGHGQSVTGLQVANDSTLVSSSLDGKVCIWDLRVTGSPRASAVPDGSQVLCVKMSPAGDCVAAATSRALVTVDLLDGAASVAPVTSAPLAKPFSDVVWNSLTGEIYAASPAGTVSVFRQTFK